MTNGISHQRPSKPSRTAEAGNRAERERERLEEEEIERGIEIIHRSRTRETKRDRQRNEITETGRDAQLCRKRERREACRRRQETEETSLQKLSRRLRGHRPRPRSIGDSCRPNEAAAQTSKTSAVSLSLSLHINKEVQLYKPT